MEIHTIKDFYHFLENYSETPDNVIFRGVRSSEFKLTPSIGRIQRKGKDLDNSEEKSLLKIFKHRSYPFTKDYQNDDLELLAIGQYHGLPTRLLDWTKNPLAGLKKIKKTLNRLGVHAGTMYPDLDGISEHIKWLRSDNH